MVEYIEREAVIKRLLTVRMGDDSYSMGIQSGVDHAIEVVKEAPAADVVPVVRCKDCVWRGTAGCPYNAFERRVERPDNGFCSDGERKENKYDPA